jgi:transposase
MTTKPKQQGQARKRHSQQYRTEVLALADRIGVAAAAKQLGLHDSQLYSWRSKARLGQERSEVEEKLAVENARLKRQLAEQAEELAILKKAAAYFAKSLK